MGTQKQEQAGSPELAEKKKKPPLYKVIIHNDDFTPMDFVVYVLTNFFKHDELAAQKIMLSVHHQGSGIAGVFTHEIAETKVLQVNTYSKNHEYPLKTTMEPE